MPTPANDQHVAERLEELYRRHLLVGEEGVASYYGSGRGYYEPELAAEERDRFSICIVRTQGDAYQTGNHDRSPCNPSRRCSFTAWLWRTTDETTY